MPVPSRVSVDQLPATSSQGALATSQEGEGIRKGTADYRRVGTGLFLAGFASFSLIYCVQPLLPEFRGTYGVNAATASLALSATTGSLAFSILASGAFSQALGRKSLIAVSMFLAALCNIMAATLPGWHWLLAARALEGVVLGGVPAVAMAYLAEEMHPMDLGKAMGLYIGGTAFGAMVGRVGMGVMSAYTSWQVAMLVLGGFCVLAAIGFVLVLPPSRNFKPRRTAFREHLTLWAGHLRNPALQRLYVIGFLLTSVFTTIFNYSTFRLSDAPYGLGRTAVSMIFLTYGLGTVASSVGGAFADRFGRRSMLVSAFAIILAGVAVTLAMPLVWNITGIALVSIGFFVGHAAASGAVGANARGAKGHASSLYLLFYYLGASVMGAVGGWFWIHGGWPAVAGLTGLCAALGIAISLLPERRIQPDVGLSPGGRTA